MTAWYRMILAVLALLVAGPVWAQTKISLVHTGIAAYTSAFVAKEQGFFKKRGLDVTLQQVAGGVLIQGLQGGSAQIATVPPTNLLLAIEGGLDLVAVAGASVSQKDDQTAAFVIATNAGITTPKDLIGKKIGVPSIGGYLYVMARKWIIDQGIDPAAVNFVEVNFPQAADLMKNGAIQASALSDPFLQRAVQNGVAKPMDYFAAILPPQTTGVLYASTRRWAEANPEAVKAFREAIAEGVAFTEKNPDAARADMAKYIKLPPEALAATVMPRLMANVTEEQIGYWVNTMHGMGLIKTRPDAAKLIVR